LAQACAVVGAAQIQNRGTLGGNIANASPAGDTFPALAVYEATVVAVSPDGQRSIPFCEVFAGVKKTSLRPAELITAIEVPWLRQRPDRQLYRKVGTRAAMAISKVVAAGLLWLNADDTIKELRFALGSVAPTVRRLKNVEAGLPGLDCSMDTDKKASSLITKDISPIDDIRSTAQYRMRVSRNLLADFLLG
jgi:CO/xanthine dehydrogenase FAD-binding subunit